MFKRELIIGDMCYMAPELFEELNKEETINGG